MELAALVKKQIEKDTERGFLVKFDTDPERYNQLANDLVGLVGEVGEFADLLKKVGLTYSNPAYKGPSLPEASKQLRSELADIVIYVIRLSTILSGDLEQDILQKMKINDERYKYLD